MSKGPTRASVILESAKEQMEQAGARVTTYRRALELAETEFNVFRSVYQRLILELAPKPRTKPAGKAGTKTAAKKAGSKKPSSKKPASPPICATCGNEEDYEDHGTGEGQHEFSTNVGARLQKLMGVSDKCTYSIDGKTCHSAPGDAIHDESMGYAGYHGFVGGGAMSVTTGGD